MDSWFQEDFKCALVEQTNNNLSQLYLINLISLFDYDNTTKIIIFLPIT